MAVGISVGSGVVGVRMRVGSDVFVGGRVTKTVVVATKGAVSGEAALRSTPAALLAAIVCRVSLLMAVLCGGRAT